jgi:hypothetical protein
MRIEELMVGQRLVYDSDSKTAIIFEVVNINEKSGTFDHRMIYKKQKGRVQTEMPDYFNLATDEQCRNAGLVT